MLVSAGAEFGAEDLGVGDLDLQFWGLRARGAGDGEEGAGVVGWGRGLAGGEGGLGGVEGLG